MAINATQALQLATLLAQTAQQFHGSNTNAGRLSQSLAASAQAGIQAEAIKKAKKEQKKKEKGGMLGSVGGLLGTAAGVALAPVTGGASLALAGGIGGALGSAAGQAIGGGGVDAMSALGAGVQGAMTGYGYGKSLPEAPSVASAPSALPPSYVPGDPLVDVTSAFSYPGTMVGAPVSQVAGGGLGESMAKAASPAIAAGGYFAPQTSVGRQVPLTPQGSPQYVGNPTAWAEQFPSRKVPVQAIPSPQKVGSTVQARPRYVHRVGQVLSYMTGNQSGYTQAYINHTAPGQPDELWPGNNSFDPYNPPRNNWGPPPL